MIFSTLDDKNECIGVFLNGEIIYEKLPNQITRTWGYTPYLAGKDIQYASLFVSTNSIGAACPQALQDGWERITNKLQSFFRSFKEAKIDLGQVCFYDLVPERFLLEFCDLKCKIIEHVFENYEEPKNYNHLLSIVKLTQDIRHRKLNISFENFDYRKAVSFKSRQWLKKLKKIDPHVKYNIFGTKTGRLAAEKNSFPILTMPKEFRSVIKPTNDYFVELDFNAAELRTLLALSGKEQPPEDIHEWNAKNVYKNITREEAKQRIFAWLYNPESTDYLSNKIYGRDEVVKKHYDGEQVSTFFNRSIPADDHHALNYIVQSTTADMVLEQAYRVFELLKEKKSYISLLIHDSIVIDLAQEDKQFLPELIEIFSKTKLGVFKVNIKGGLDYGNMREMKL